MTDRIALVIATLLGLLGMAGSAYQRNANRQAFQRIAVLELQGRGLAEEFRLQVAFDRIRRIEDRDW